MENELMSPVAAFQELVKNFAGAPPSVGRVKKGSVDENKGVCEIVPTASKEKITRAFLNVISGAQLTIVPADDSYVAYMHSRNMSAQAYIVACSKIRKIILKTSPAGTVEFELSDAGVEVKAGANGRVKIDPSGTMIGSGAQKMVRGDELKAWADQMVVALSAIITWGAGVTPPLAGVTAPTFPGTVLSSKNKVE